MGQSFSDQQVPGSYVYKDSSRSDRAAVASGVPQGTVLGPLLFLLHINDLPREILSLVRLFADDCLLYRAISSREGAEILQHDLNSLCAWGQRWGMFFNVKKCNVMHITWSRGPITKFYSPSRTYGQLSRRHICLGW